MAVSSPGAYKGYNITGGSDAQVAAQIAAIDAGSISKPAKEPAVLSSAKGKQIVQNKITPVVQTGMTAINDATVARTNASMNTLPDDEQDQDPEMRGLLSDEDRERKQLNQIYKNNQKLYGQMAVANTQEARAEIGNLQADWDRARGEQDRANKLENAVYNQAGFRTGQARYAPELNASMMADVQSEGIAKLSKLDAGYRSAIGKVQAALRSNNLQLAFSAAAEARKFHEDALGEIRTQKAQALEIAEKATASKKKVTRQMAIIDLVKQGITDPAKIFDYLNYDEGGKQVGDITADEIDETLKRLIPTGSALGGFKFSNDEVGKLMGTGLSAMDVQAILDDLNDGGPETVLAGLSGNQKAVVSKILNGVQGTGVGNTITIGEARDLGIPVSLVGRSQAQVIADISSATPPAWFQEYVTSRWENPDTPVDPTGLKQLWTTFREKVNNDFISGKKAGAKDAGANDIESQIDAAFD